MRLLRARSVQDGQRVVDPVFVDVLVKGPHWVRGSDAPTVEADHPAETLEAPNEVPAFRDLQLIFDGKGATHHHEKIGGPSATDVVGDVQAVTCLRVLELGRVDHRRR